MIDNTKVNHYENQLLGAFDLLIDNKLKGIAYDQTIICTIEDNKDKKDGKYRVKTNDGLVFDAYSEITNYQKNASVYVTIPQGNYNGQKIIIGRASGEDQIKPYNYVSPFEQFFPLTEELFKTKNENMEIYSGAGSLIANENGDSNIITNLPNSTEAGTAIQIAKLVNLNESGHKVLGIKADFQTLVSNAVVGNYGLIIQIKTNGNRTYNYTLSIDDMIGNPYNFYNYYTQEKLISLENIDGSIIKVDVYFAQVANSFKDVDGKLIGISELENLHVQNLELYLGILTSEKKEEFVELYYANGEETDKIFNKNSEDLARTIGLRWIHIDKDGNPFNMALSSSQEKFNDFEIRWYRYEVGVEAADEFSSIYWKNIEEEKDENGNLIKKKNFKIENIKLNAQAGLEKFKVIAFVNGVSYRSNILEFENVDSPEQQITKFINPLTIVPDDNSNGNYMLYGQDHRILEQSLAKRSRSLKAYFDAEPTDGKIGSQISDVNNLQWIFPAKNTMIKLESDSAELSDDEETWTINGIPEYTIVSNWQPSATNNTVFCSYKDPQGISYSASKEFTFGVAGTMGTEQTLVIDFADNRNAVQVKANENDEEVIVKFKVQLYDLSGNSLDVSDAIWKWKGQKDPLPSLSGETVPDGELWLSRNNNFTDINDIKILECSVGNLTAYFPVPLCISTSSYKYIDGPTQVIYKPDGVPYYYNTKYKIYNSNNEQIISDVSWKIYTLDSSDTVGVGALKNENLLNPYPLYIEEASDYAVQCLVNSSVVWTQPILVLMNRWPSSTINDWDGESTVINDENNTILTQAIAVGKKDKDSNTFSGVMLGDWSEKNVDESITHTGLYGFHQGEMSYAFKDDGTAFIGKSGLGRIEFDGNKGIIESASYELANDKSLTVSDNSGLQFNFVEGKIHLVNNNEKTLKERILKSILLDVTNADYPLKIGENKNENFKVKWDGTLEAINGKFSGVIEANDGNIGSGFSVKDNKVSLSGIVTLKDGSLAIEQEYDTYKYVNRLLANNGSMNLQTEYYSKNTDGSYSGPLLGAGMEINTGQISIYGNKNDSKYGSRLICDSTHIGISNGTDDKIENGVIKQNYVVCYDSHIAIGGNIQFDGSEITGMKILFGSDTN